MGTLFYIVFSMLIPTLRAEDAESDMQRALKNTNFTARQTQVVQIFGRWLDSRDETKIGLAKKYLGVAGAPTELMLKMVHEKKAVRLYPEALALRRSSYSSSRTDRANLVQDILEALPNNSGLRKALIEGAGGLEPMVKNGVLVLQPTEESQAFAKALFDAHALEGVKKVSYSIGTESIPLDKNSIELKNLPDIIARFSDQKTLIPWLMRVRSALSVDSQPSKEAFTGSIIRIIETGPSDLSLAFAEAARNSMVMDRAEDYRKSGEPARTLRHLTIDRSDTADLRLARTLMDRPTTHAPRNNPKGTPVTGLDDVEVITWTGPPEHTTEIFNGQRRVRPGYERVNHPPVNEVYNLDGWRITDLLDAQNFEEATHLPGEAPITQSAIARNESLRKKGREMYSSYPLGSAPNVDGRPQQVDCGVVGQFAGRKAM